MKCPYCKADIEENARFCFYCMTSLEEKETVKTPVFQKKYRAVAIAALFAVLLIVGGIVWWHLSKKPGTEPPEEQSAAGESLTVGTESENSATQPNQNANGVTVGPATVPDPPSANKAPDQSVSSPPAGNFDQPPSSSSGTASGNSGTTIGNGGGNTGSGSAGTAGGTTASGNTGSSSIGGTTGSGSVQGSTGGDTAGSTVPSAPTVQPEQTEPAAPSVTPTTPSERPEQEPTQPEASVPGNSETNEDTGSTASPPTAAVTYTYRVARYAVDDYHVTANVDDCVVITGVQTPAADGVYRIPSTLEGKRVIAVVTQAFNDENIRDTVKEVHLPASVRTVHDYAFSACRNLTDIYFEGNSVYVSTLAFAAKEKRTGTLTIHCAYECNNRDLRYYRNIAESYYDAEWSEA